MACCRDGRSLRGCIGRRSSLPILLDGAHDAHASFFGKIVFPSHGHFLHSFLCKASRPESDQALDSMASYSDQALDTMASYFFHARSARPWSLTTFRRRMRVSISFFGF